MLGGSTWPNATVPYRNVLVPTDGSPASRRGAACAARLAAALGARLTALYVVPEGVPTIFSGDRLYASRVLGPRARAALRAAAEAALGQVEREAADAGVAVQRVRVRERAPWRAISRAASRHRCDLVVMGTRGVGGLAALGSQTLKTVSHARVPVLVCR